MEDIQEIDVKIDPYYKVLAEYIKLYGEACGLSGIENEEIGTIISYSIEERWSFYEKIVEQIITVPLPMRSLSLSTLECLLAHLNELDVECLTLMGKRPDYINWHRKLMNHNIDKLERAINQMTLAESWDPEAMEQREEEIEETLLEQAEGAELDENGMMTLRMRISASHFRYLEWMQKEESRHLEEELSMGDMLMICMATTYETLKDLGGGFKLVIPLHGIGGIKGGEALEEVVNTCLDAIEDQEDAKEELRHLHVFKKIIQIVLWSEFTSKIKEKELDHVVIYKK